MNGRPCRIAVIGCGNIGARHVQALGLLDRGATVYLVDPSVHARRRAEALLHQESGSVGHIAICGMSDASGLPDELDVTIIATAAVHRRYLTEALLKSKLVRYLILEKFLFQAVEDYGVIAELLARTGTRAWVNCPRRLWPGYRALKNELADSNGICSLEVATHGRYGVGTSAIHFLDALAFLTGDYNFDLSAALMDRETVVSRDHGVDLTGTLFGAAPRGAFFRYTAYSAGRLPPLTYIDSPILRAIINEPGQIMRISRAAQDWEWREEAFAILPQSQMTHLLVQDLIDRGTCELPDYTTSSHLHMAILVPLLHHYRMHIDRNANECPIT